MKDCQLVEESGVCGEPGGLLTEELQIGKDYAIVFWGRETVAL